MSSRKKKKSIKTNQVVTCLCGHTKSSHTGSWCERLDAYTSCRCGKYVQDNLGFLERVIDEHEAKRD